jgi:hypothetical protein
MTAKSTDPRLHGSVREPENQQEGVPDDEFAMKNAHSLDRFAVKCPTPDLPVVYCLRAIAEHSQKEINPRIAWGGTKDADWQRDGACVTFRFSSPQNRESFVQTATRLLPRDSWAEVSRSDDDPARAQ